MNERQRRFAENYAGNPNAAEAARKAGYSEKTARSTGQRLLTNGDIKERIRQLQDEMAQDRILTVAQVKAFWSDTVNDSTEKTADRLKASELLAKAAGMFLPQAILSKQDDGAKEDVIIYLPQKETEEECLWLNDESE